MSAILCVIEISFQVGDMEEMDWIPPSFCFQASALALYLLSVSGCVGFICEIDIINNKVKYSLLFAHLMSVCWGPGRWGSLGTAQLHGCLSLGLLNTRPCGSHFLYCYWPLSSPSYCPYALGQISGPL